LLVADTLGRRVVAPAEVPAGVFTALIGAPFLIWLLARAHRQGSTD
jgi:ABC-type Fe3+-siderophore transport system permease subunit